MDIQDDPALWLFSGQIDHFATPIVSETDFLRTQVAIIEAYVERFPSDEREFRALAWIEANASQYRHQWQTQATTSGHRVQSASGH
jgi:hypothetical protein